MSAAEQIDWQEPTQGSDEWHQWRADGIGASEIAAVLGISPWMTAYQLWQAKTGGNVVQFEHAAMRRGKELEAAAVFDLEVEHGITVDRSRTLFQHPVLSFIRASLDGMTDNNTVVEIKCPGPAQHAAMRDQVPDYYVAQVQQQMLVSGADRTLFWVWHPEHGGYAHEIKADPKWHERIIEAAKEFWARVEARQWPSDELTQLAEELAWAKAREAEAKAARVAAERALIEAMRSRDMKKIETASGIKASVVQRKAVDKEALQADPDYQALMPALEELKLKVKDIEGRHKTAAGNPYIRLTMP